MPEIIRTEWEFRAVNPPQDRNSLSKFMPATVPGVVQLDLMKHGDIPDPYIRDNLKSLAWMTGVDWEYRTVLPAVPQGKKCFIVFEGIDTLSTIFLNGKELGSTDNMHRSYEFDLTDRLTDNGNTISAVIRCPVKYCEEKFKSSDVKASSNQCQGDPKFYYPYVRKSSYSAGWDWLGSVSPALGLWKNAYLRIDDSPFVLRSSNYKVELSKDFKMAEITAKLEIDAFENTILIASLEVDGMELLPSHRVHLKKGSNTADLRPVKIINPTLWWPNGHGIQSLYRMTLRLTNPGAETIVDEKHIGIRKVRLLQPKDKEGRKFVIEINGRKIFAKGGNWCPNDAYLPRVSDEKLKRLVNDAKDANFNILRTWGGGFYEDSRFFELCDRAGMMVWLDLAFACNLYPETDDLVSTTKIEVEQNLRRIRNHASLVLLSGNNECYPCHYVWNKLGNDQQFHGRKYYEEIFPEIYGRLAPDLPYIPGSPYTPDKPDDPDSQTGGDRHAWWLGFGISKEQNYTHMTQEKGRFISEFGYLGMPPYSTVKQFLQGKDISKIDSDVLTSHQNTIVTMKMLKEYVEFLYPLPDNLKNYCYLSMVGQAEMLRYAVEHFRRRKFNCAGSVIWQYNDCWPAPSWSAVDYYLRRKAHYYYIKRAYAPVIASFEKDEKGVLNVWSVNDEDKTYPCELRIFKCDCVNRKQILSKEFEMPSNESFKITKITEKTDFKKEFLIAEVTRDGKLAARTTYFGVFPKEFRWPEKQDFSVTHEKLQGNMFKVSVSSMVLLKDLYLNIDFADPDALFSDNFIDVLPGDKIEIKVKTSKPLTIEEFRNAFSLMHIGLNFALK
ncbi:MAG TPA: hypothetical protein DCZ94_02545 [Lentisphaeria bacterium]|nr:MAG: hypothetical protein A2X48_21685 [Lentisphaerae bacterium GWF2_49_21]HBC85814.1 hypothetical protein [Lentisphaeria bacterium]